MLGRVFRCCGGPSAWDLRGTATSGTTCETVHIRAPGGGVRFLVRRDCSFLHGRNAQGMDGLFRLFILTVHICT